MTTIKEKPSAHAGTPESEMAFFHHDWEQGSSIAVEIASTVAKLSGKSHESLEPIHDFLDPDGLESIFEPRSQESSRNNNHLWFSYEGYGVTVYGNGFVIVRRLD